MEDFIVINQIGLYDLQVLLYKYCSKLWKKNSNYIKYSI